MSNKSEAKEIERDGGTVHRNSGRGWIQKGDGQVGPFIVDYKEYTETFGVSRKVWAKTTKDALRMRGLPALKLVLGAKEGTEKVRLWVISETMFNEMLEAWQEKYDEG